MPPGWVHFNSHFDLGILHLFPPCLRGTIVHFINTKNHTKTVIHDESHRPTAWNLRLSWLTQHGDSCRAFIRLLMRTCWNFDVHFLMTFWVPHCPISSFPWVKSCRHLVEHLHPAQMPHRLLFQELCNKILCSKSLFGTSTNKPCLSSLLANVPAENNKNPPLWWRQQPKQARWRVKMQNHTHHPLRESVREDPVSAKIRRLWRTTATATLLLKQENEPRVFTSPRQERNKPLPISKWTPWLPWWVCKKTAPVFNRHCWLLLVPLLSFY